MNFFKEDNYIHQISVFLTHYPLELWEKQPFGFYLPLVKGHKLTRITVNSLSF